MITPKDRDMNRSRDVEGPTLKRSYDQENKHMKGMKTDLFHDNAPTGTISKHPLSELHEGDHETPLTAAGTQQVVVPMSMGSDTPDHTPTLAKGGTRDQQHGGKKSGSYKETSSSEGAPRNPKGMGRSVAKEMMSAEKKKSKY